MANFNLENYVPVHERIEKFYSAHPEGRIVTNLQKLSDEGFVLFQASVYRDSVSAEPAATGHAYEMAGQGYINKTSHIENCETSAIGRALANLGIEVSRGIASREEMQKVERMQNQPNGKQNNGEAVALQNLITKLCSELNKAGDGIAWSKTVLRDYAEQMNGKPYDQQNTEELTLVLEDLKGRLAAAQEVK